MSLSQTDLLGQKKDELDEMLAKIDADQQEVDDLSVQVSNEQLEIEQLRRELSHTKKIRHYQDLETSGPRKDPGIDESKFSSDHRDFIMAKRNVIADLTNQISAIQGSTDLLEDETSGMQRDSVAWTCERGQLAKDISRAYSRRKELEQDVSMTRERLRELATDISMHERTAKDSEAALGELIARQESVEAMAGGKGEITRNVEHLDREIAELTRVVDMLDEDIENIKSDRENFEEKTNKDISRQQEVSNWKSEEDRLKSEMADLRREVAEAENKLKQALSSADVKEARYNRLKALAALATETSGDVGANDDVSVDVLLKKFDRASAEAAQRKDTGRDSLDEVVLNNAKLEALIAKRREELTRAISLFQGEQARLKAETEYRRTKAFDEERKIVEQIEAAKLKIARKKRK